MDRGPLLEREQQMFAAALDADRAKTLERFGDRPWLLPTQHARLGNIRRDHTAADHPPFEVPLRVLDFRKLGHVSVLRYDAASVHAHGRSHLSDLFTVRARDRAGRGLRRPLTEAELRFGRLVGARRRWDAEKDQQREDQPAQRINVSSCGINTRSCLGMTRTV
jgi:hypothetical protein